MTPDELRVVQQIAYEYWLRRGQPAGSPEVDWDEALKAFSAVHGSRDSDGAPGSTPTDLGVEPVPELSHDEVEDKSKSKGERSY